MEPRRRPDRGPRAHCEVHRLHVLESGAQLRRPERGGEAGEDLRAVPHHLPASVSGCLRHRPYVCDCERVTAQQRPCRNDAQRGGGGREDAGVPEAAADLQLRRPHQVKLPVLVDVDRHHVLIRRGCGVRSQHLPVEGRHVGIAQNGAFAPRSAADHLRNVRLLRLTTSFGSAGVDVPLAVAHAPPRAGVDDCLATWEVPASHPALI
mmetsp:Transcript_39384/g.111690  ORF Transcript_39384/g.111690 Transcript_39384/m.111690 type:complete len:207 (-) Transcript_39384:1709-2329(-)